MTIAKIKKDKIRQELERAPWEYSFHQFLAILELINKNKKPFGSGKRPSDEAAILNAYCSFSAPSSDCISFKHKQDQAYLTINQTSLIGINGILPQRYSEKVITKMKEGNSQLLDFLNIFNHRLFGLMHKIEKRTQLNLNKDWMHNFEYCNAIAGIINNNSVKKYRQILPTFASFLWQKNKSPNGLVGVIRSMFPKFKVQIDQFIPEWIDINDECRARLDRKPLRDKMLGHRAQCVSRAIKVIINVDSKASYDSILPGTENFEILHDIAQYYCPPGFKIKFELRLPKRETPKCKMNAQNKLGYNTWIGENNAHNLGCTIEF